MDGGNSKEGGNKIFEWGGPGSLGDYPGLGKRLNGARKGGDIVKQKPDLRKGEAIWRSGHSLEKPMTKGKMRRLSCDWGKK